MPIYRPLDEAERAAVQAGVARAERMAGVERLSAADLQALYDVLLSEAEAATAAIEAVGYAFGEALLAHGGLEWALAVDDAYGDEISVALTGVQLGCHPLSMIANRLKDGEAWDLADLAERTVGRLRQLATEAARS